MADWKSGGAGRNLPDQLGKPVKFTFVSRCSSSCTHEQGTCLSNGLDGAAQWRSGTLKATCMLNQFSLEKISQTNSGALLIGSEETLSKTLAEESKEISFGRRD